MNLRLSRAISHYQNTLSDTDWMDAEVYKFEFANWVAERVNWGGQSDEEISDVLLASQKLRYTNAGNVAGINFLTIPAQRFGNPIMTVAEVKKYRAVRGVGLENIAWSSKPVGYTAKAAWLSCLYPGRFYPTGKTGFDYTIKYLQEETAKIGKTGLSYLSDVQSHFGATLTHLKATEVGSLWLAGLKRCYGTSDDLNLPLKMSLSSLDWCWIVQDFHFFVLRRILEVDNAREARKIEVAEPEDPTVVEGGTYLAVHLKRDRDPAFAAKAKRLALERDPFLHCEVCGFSYLKTYGSVGEGFIECHHLEPLGERTAETETRSKDYAMLCANCHRMVHRSTPVMSPSKLREMMNRP